MSKPHGAARTLAAALALLHAAGCTEPNPAYDSGRDADVPPPADDGGPDVDAGPDADADADVEPEAEVETDDDAVEADAEDADPPEDAGDEGTVEVVPGDVDGDGVSDDLDNCPGVWNPLQENCDGDGLGDRCDTGDEDGDTLPDPIDVCACGGAAGTHDDDGDGIVDDCDNCPLVSNPRQENSNLDGLGDACAPPSARDLRLLIRRFEPFLALPSDPGWHEEGGLWAIGSDAYAQTDASAEGYVSAFYDPWAEGDDLFVQGTFDITAFGPGVGITRKVGLVARATRIFTGGVRWYSCVVETMNGRVDIETWDGTTRRQIRQTPAGMPLGLGAYRMSFLVRGTGLACALEAPGAAPVVVEATSTAYPIGAPGVRAFRLAASFRGLMVAR